MAAFEGLVDDDAVLVKHERAREWQATMPIFDRLAPEGSLLFHLCVENSDVADDLRPHIGQQRIRDGVLVGKI